MKSTEERCTEIADTVARVLDSYNIRYAMALGMAIAKGGIHPDALRDEFGRRGYANDELVVK